jgi:autotransporter-associated beta strand protein
MQKIRSIATLSRLCGRNAENGISAQANLDKRDNKEKAMRGSISESVLMQSIFRRGICSAGLRAVAVVVLCLAAALWAGPAGATSLTWDKNGATAGQTDGAGVWLATDQWWDGAANATWTSGDDANFGNGGAGDAVTLASPTTVNSLTMNSFDGTYTLGTVGKAITLNTGLTMNSGAGNTTIISPVTLGGPQSWLNNSVGVLTVSGALTNGANLLTIGGTGNTSISGLIGNGAGGITKLGEGTLTLSGSNTYTGDTTISNGVLKLQGGAFSTAARNYSIASGAVLNLDGATAMANGTSTISGSGTLRITNGLWCSNFDGPKVVISLSPGGLIDVQAGGYIRNGGWQPFNWTGNSARLNVDGSLNMWNGNNVTVDALTGSGTVVNTYGGGPNLTVGIANGSGTFSGTISDISYSTVSLTKTGAGTQTLSGSNSYKGATTVSQGKLLLGEGGSMGATAVSVTGTATYGTSYASSGNTIAGGNTLDLAAGTTLDMRDDNTNTLSFIGTGASTLSGAGLYLDLGATAGACDILALTGAATVTGNNTLYFDVLGSLAVSDHAYTLITAASGLTGGTLDIGTTLPGYVLTLDRVGTAVYLNVALDKIPGDTNEDQVVDAADFITLKRNFGTESGAGVTEGNFDGDPGTVDWNDLSILMTNMDVGSQAPAAAPEPATLGLLAIGALAIIRRRRA